MKYIVTIYCGKAGPVKDIEIDGSCPADAICDALWHLQQNHKGGRRGLTEVHVNETAKCN